MWKVEIKSSMWIIFIPRSTFYIPHFGTMLHIEYLQLNPIISKLKHIYSFFTTLRLAPLRALLLLNP